MFQSRLLGQTESGFDRVGQIRFNIWSRLIRVDRIIQPVNCFLVSPRRHMPVDVNSDLDAVMAQLVADVCKRHAGLDEKTCVGVAQ